MEAPWADSRKEHTVEVILKRDKEPYRLLAENDLGIKIPLDASPDIGGGNEGFRPMQMVLAALGGCASFDLIHILKKQRQDLKDIEVRVSGDRDPQAVPAPFTKMHLHFILKGTIDDKKAAQAVEWAVTKYCSVGTMLEKSGPITFSYEIIPE